MRKIPVKGWMTIPKWVRGAKVGTSVPSRKEWLSHRCVPPMAIPGAGWCTVTKGQIPRKQEVHWRIREQSNRRSHSISGTTHWQHRHHATSNMGNVWPAITHMNYRILRESNWCGKSTSTFFQHFHSCFSAKLWPVCNSEPEALKTCQRLTPLKGWSEAFVANGLFFKLFSTNTSAVDAQTTSLTDFVL